MGEIMRMGLTTVVGVYIPARIEVCGERAEPEYIDDIDGDWIQYTGEAGDHDWEIYIEASGREFYIRASIDDDTLDEFFDCEYDRVEEYILSLARAIEKELKE